MFDNDLDWLAAQRPQPLTLDRGTTARLRAELVEHATAARRRRLTARRRPRQRRVIPLMTVAALGAAAVIVAASSLPTTSAPTAPVRIRTAPLHVAATKPADAPLLQLASYIRSETKPAGDATLVQRTQAYPGRPAITGVDLYTDSGQYYYAPTLAAMPASIASGDQGDGFMARELAAARFAANGDLSTARQQMANAALDPKLAAKLASETPAQRAQQMADQKQRLIDQLTAGMNATQQPATRAALKAKINAIQHAVPLSQQAQADNEIWSNSLDALVAGASDPQVRAGILRLLSTVNAVNVAQTTTGGQPSLTLTAGGDAMPANYQEQLIINADTGLPIQFTGGTPGQAPSVTVTYKVSRVTLADIAAGH